MSMEKQNYVVHRVHVWKYNYVSKNNNQLQQSIYLYHKRNMSQIWQVNTLCQSQS